MYNNIFFPKNRSFYEVTWKNIVDVGQATDNDACVHATYPRLQTHTQNMQ